MLKNVHNVKNIYDYGDVNVNSVKELITRPITSPVNNLHILGPLLKKLNEKVTEVVMNANT
jgi:hypothetical protein